MENAEKEIKTILISLLISNPKQCTVHQLWQDFYEMEGRPIPLKQLGFRTLEEYLCSIPDVVKINGSGPNALLEHITSSKSEHIQQMVLKQKKHKRSSVKMSSHRTYQIPHRRKSKRSSSGNGKPKTLSLNNTLRPTEDYNNRHREKTLKTNDLIILEDIHSKPILKKEILETNIIQPTMSFKEEHQSLRCKKEIYLNSSPQLEDNRLSHSSGNQKTCDVLFEEQSDSIVPMKIQHNLKNLIKKFPNGLGCCKLPEEYHSVYGKNLYYEDYGYRSLIEMCSDLPNIFNYKSQFSDDYILFDKDRPIDSLNDFQEVDSKLKGFPKEHISKTHVLEELQDIKWCPDLLPEDVVTIYDEIDRCFPSDINVNDILEISVAEIFDLSKFWVYLTFGELKNLMNELQYFFSINHSVYLLPEVLMKEGLYCVSVYNGLYHRCVIVNTQLQVPHTVRVLFVDYGTVSNVSTKQMWFLPKKFSTVPCQAIRARLSNIYPVYKNRPWSALAVTRFQKLITDKDVVAKITKIVEKDHVLEVYLADITNQDNIFYINDKLVSEGYALYTGQERKEVVLDEDCLPNVQYIHLYPEFYEIESGMAPTTSELRYIVNNKISLHFLIPQYFNISYTENINKIQSHHRSMKKERILNFSIDKKEVEEFDLGYFPEFIRDPIQNLYDPKNKTKRCDVIKIVSSESVREYSCNKKRISQLINNPIGESTEGLQSVDKFPTESPFLYDPHLNSTSVTKENKFKLNLVNNCSRDYQFFEDNSTKLKNTFEYKNKQEESVQEYSCNKHRVMESIHIENENAKNISICPSEHSLSSGASKHESDMESLNNSFRKLNLKNDNNYVPTSHNYSNPFRNNLNSTNPFWSTNPFLNNVDETINSKELIHLIAKPACEISPIKNINNVIGSEKCLCKTVKQLNTDETNTLAKSDVIDNTFKNVSQNNVTPVEDIAEKRHVKAPPGFTAQHLNDTITLQTTAAYPYSTNNPYYNNIPYFPNNYFNFTNGFYSNRLTDKIFHWQYLLYLQSLQQFPK